EDGIRDFHVTGVQTCALPICTVGVIAAALMASIPIEAMQTHYASCDSLLGTTVALLLLAGCALTRRRTTPRAALCGACVGLAFRSEERRVGKGRRSGRVPCG